MMAVAAVAVMVPAIWEQAVIQAVRKAIMTITTISYG
jgi:hypothetical protein